jgi:hypothetical protein
MKPGVRGDDLAGEIIVSCVDDMNCVAESRG